MVNEVKNIDAEVQKEWKDSKYKKFPFSRQIEDLGAAYAVLTYNDGTTVEPLSKHYNEISRTNMKSISIVSEDGNTLFTLDIINNKLIYRLRNVVPPIQDHEKMRKLANEKFGHMWFSNPKRCFILGTEGRTVFVWDSGEVTEITDWGKVSPYDKPNLRTDEK